MSRLFGPLRQMGYVVPDIEAAMKHWHEVCGIGPWFYSERLPLTRYWFDRIEYPLPHFSIALANSGDVQIELIEQRCQTPSLYQEFLSANPKGGLQHWSSWPENYDELYDRAVANGYTPAQEGDAPRGRFVYFREEGHPGTIIEMSHATAKRRAIFDAVRVAAVAWDGRDPIRTGWPNID
jgi:hypothetical protein